MLDHTSQFEAARAFLKALKPGNGEHARSERRAVIDWIRACHWHEVANGMGAQVEQLEFFALLFASAKNGGRRSLASYLFTEWSKGTSNIYGAAYGQGYLHGHADGSHYTTKRKKHSVQVAFSKRGSTGGKKKNEASNRAREFVVQEWAAHREAYGGNKSAFARHYVRRVFNELGVEITEKTVRESWLADTPAAT